MTCDRKKRACEILFADRNHRRTRMVALDVTGFWGRNWCFTSNTKGLYFAQLKTYLCNSTSKLFVFQFVKYPPTGTMQELQGWKLTRRNLLLLNRNTEPSRLSSKEVFIYNISILRWGYRIGIQFNHEAKHGEVAALNKLHNWTTFQLVSLLWIQSGVYVNWNIWRLA